jgi:hypothetical protein
MACNVPGGSYTLHDIAEVGKEGFDLYAGLHSEDLAEQGNLKLEAEVVEQRGRPVVLVQMGAHLYALPVFRLTRREDFDLDALFAGGN